MDISDHVFKLLNYQFNYRILLGVTCNSYLIYFQLIFVFKVKYSLLILPLKLSIKVLFLLH